MFAFIKTTLQSGRETRGVRVEAGRTHSTQAAESMQGGGASNPGKGVIVNEKRMNSRHD